MKISIKVLTIILAVLSLSACTNRENGTSATKFKESDIVTTENSVSDIETEIEDNEKIYTVDRSKIKISDKSYIDRGYSKNTEGHLENSYSLVEGQSYLDKWFYTYEFYLPMFTNEIKGDAGEKIKKYYNEKYADYKNMERNGIYDEVDDLAMSYNTYDYYDYSVIFLEPYIVVNNYSEINTGGAHGLNGKYTEVFDTRTGKLITMKDLFGNKKDSLDKMKALVTEEAKKIPNKDNIIFSNLSSKLSKPEALKFSLLKNGVVFIFNPYEIASFADGIIEITVSYELLKNILKIDVPN